MTFRFDNVIFQVISVYDCASRVSPPFWSTAYECYKRWKTLEVESYRNDGSVNQISSTRRSSQYRMTTRKQRRSELPLRRKKSYHRNVDWRKLKIYPSRYRSYKSASHASIISSGVRLRYEQPYNNVTTYSTVFFLFCSVYRCIPDTLFPNIIIM